MSRRSNANSASALFHGNRLAADSSHGVTCSHRRCDVFDPNIDKKHVKTWRCEAHGGSSATFDRVRDSGVKDKVKGGERRARFARVRARQEARNPKQGYSAAKQARIDAAIGSRVGSHGCVNDRKTLAPIANPRSKQAAKKSARQQALELLGLTEADIVTALGSN